MDIVSFETAIRLKEAGFPQPKVSVFGFWYGQEAELGVVIAYERMAIEGAIYYFDAPERCFYAPTATDILRELSHRPGFHYMVGYSQTHGNWRCTEFYALSAVPIRSEYHENPAEAAALAWLLIHEKNKA